MPKVAIIGSCITRDLWPIRGEALQDVLYISRTSLASLAGEPVAEFQPASDSPGGLKRHQHNALLADLRKTALARLVAFRPDHLIFDLIDERFDLLSIGRARATRTWELEASGYLAQPAFAAARPVPRLSAQCERLWRDAALEIAAVVRGTCLAQAQLILHVSRWAHEQQAPDGTRTPIEGVEVLPGEPAEIAQHNHLLAAYEAWLAEVMPPMARLDAGHLRVADAAHQWGLSPFHYVPAYYAEIWSQLAALGVPVISPPSGAPSAPAA